MIQRFSWSREGSILRLSGELDQDLLNQLWNSRFEAMQGITLIDLSAIMHVDTAGIALLVHLVHTGKEQGESVTLVGVSDNLHALAQLYNLPDQALPY